MPGLEYVIYLIQVQSDEMGKIYIYICTHTHLYTSFHLWFIESHVISHDVELHGVWPLITFDPVSIKR